MLHALHAMSGRSRKGTAPPPEPLAPPSAGRKKNWLDGEPGTTPPSAKAFKHFEQGFPVEVVPLTFPPNATQGVPPHSPQEASKAKGTVTY